jgi:multifunctional 2-oxoglutarate metabolism enzyme
VIETTAKVTLPELGESVTEGSIVEWRKRPGDYVEQGETLVDITTDKVDVEVPATAAGTVTAIHGDEGATVTVGSVLAEIDTTARKPDGAAAPKSKPAQPPTEVTPSGYGSGGSAKAPAETVSKPGRSSGLATPQARRIAARVGIDLVSVKGSGPEGLILREDVEDAIADGSAKRANGVATAPQPPVPAQAKITPLKGPLGALVGYMEQSLSIPTATSFRTLGVGTLEARRTELNNALRAAGRPEKISFTHVIAYALVQGAKDIPGITASFRREGATPQKVESGINLGIAVDAQRKDGSRFLIVPVIKSADALDFVRFRAVYEALIAKARDNKLEADDLTGATFTLTNPGGIGTTMSVPRLMAGQGAIIAAGAIAYPPGFTKASDSVLASLGIEKIMSLTSTYDHRVIQGALSGEYLRRAEQLLGGADRFYESIFASFGLTAGALAQPVSSAALDVGPASTVTMAGASDEMMRAVAAGMALVYSIRRFGHLAANLDPLGMEPQGDRSLDPRTYSLTPALMSAIPAPVLRVQLPGDSLADVLPKLRDTYASTIAYEIEHISNEEQRHWLRDYIERGVHRVPLAPARKAQLLMRLTKVETMERYLRRNFIGQKTFSIEGIDVMIVMLEEIINMLAEDGTPTAVIGMAHRGRLATIAHVVNRPYEEILAEFETAEIQTEEEGDEASDLGGDVKYHHGATGIYHTINGTDIRVELAHNPSHLEAVDGVVEGQTRALQTDHTANIPSLDFSKAAPILVHGDASFPGQGVVAETFNLQSLRGFTTGGTIHIIANNQIGFTTNPSDARSTRYSSDLAKGFDVPIVHVNADDVEACIAAVHLTLDFRHKFGRDIVIDLIGYRRFGHNETDEPAYTQPGMYEKIKAHPTVRELFAASLVAQSVLTKEQVQEMSDAATARITEAHKAVREGDVAKLIAAGHEERAEAAPPPPVSYDRATRTRWADELVGVPPGFTINAKLVRQFERRKAMLEKEGEVDWGLCESLAFASLLAEGIPLRISGQDTERGTFSHRHAVLHDAKDDKDWTPLQHLTDAKASFEIYNSPLSEYAILGFEYGYSGALPEALVMWEAQYGDFNNGAQIIIDQFISAGYAKWGQTSRLTMLLPHGYEGSGPEHSSARLERFLSLVAERNIRIAIPSTAAQYFHLLRRQARSPEPAPLVIMTPKSLLRSRSSYSNVEDLASGKFRDVLDDPAHAQSREKVKRIVLCSGKIYYDLIGDPDYASMQATAIVRVEQLAPFPLKQLLELIESYPNAETVVWAQEEPKNMGARAYVRRRLVERLPARIKDIGYTGRPYRSSPSEGYPGAHAVEQHRILKAALAE